MGFSKRFFVSALLSIFSVPLSGIAWADLPVLDLKNSRVAVPSFALQTNNNGALNEIKAVSYTHLTLPTNREV